MLASMKLRICSGFQLKYRDIYSFVLKHQPLCQKSHILLPRLRTRWTQGWDAPIKFYQPLWVTTVKSRSFPNTTRIVSQDLLLENPRKSTGKINTVSFFFVKSSKCIIKAPEETFKLKAFIFLKELRCEMPKY